MADRRGKRRRAEVENLNIWNVFDWSLVIPRVLHPEVENARLLEAAFY